MHDDLDALLIFVGLSFRATIRSGWIDDHPQAALFSAIVTAFLIRALDDLDPNYQRQSSYRSWISLRMYATSPSAT